MPTSEFDVVIVGAGCAGMSAAIGLAKAGFGVVVLEAAAYPGAENWSGCVYFCENLVHPSLLGPDGMEGLAWERRLVERGIFGCNGQSLLGMKYRDPESFRLCYTVLRPVFDHHLAQLAVKAGVVLLNNTTAESLIREGNRVIGAATNRGPVYADVTFLTEGDASHLVAREGYERLADPKRQPKFLHGIKQIIDLPPGAVEKNFGLGPDEGAAYEIVLRNGTLRGQPARLNMGGFVYTNRQSLSIGLVLPAERLHEHFGGDPNLLMEWFENLPDLQMWLKGGTRGVFGAKLIRGGGIKDIPRMVDDGLAIGGAATAIGVDFPYPNYTGPATRMGLQFVEAAKSIRQARGTFSQAALEQLYLQPLKQTRYWRDVEYLRSWPGYVEKTRIFFGRNLDLTLGSAYLWTRPKHWLPRKLVNWVKMLLQLSGPGRWRETVQELRYLNRALHLSEVTGRPAVGMLLLHGWMNTFRDLAGKPRPAVAEAGQIHMVYSVGGNSDGIRLPLIMQRWFRRFAPVLAAAAKHIYHNDDTPLPQKLRAATQLLMQQVNLLDAVLFGFVAATAGCLALGLLAMDWLLGRLPGKTQPRRARGIYGQFADAAKRACDLTPLVPAAALKWEDRLGQLAYLTAKQSHIHLHWPQQIERKTEVVKAGIWHVCPAHVYEAKVNPFGQVQLVVNYENCIKCETCWRTSDLADWGRDGRHRFIYPVQSPILPRLLSAMDEAGRASATMNVSVPLPETESMPRPNGLENFHTLAQGISKLERKLDELSVALDEEPRTIDVARSEYLALLGRYAQQLAGGLVTGLHGSRGLAANAAASLAAAAAGKVAELNRHLLHRKYAWAVATGRQVRQHHLARLRLFLSPATMAVDGRHANGPLEERDGAIRSHRTDEMIERLDQVFGVYAWRDLEKEGALTPLQDRVLLDLLGQTPAVEVTAHSPFRKALLAELGRRDPSLAYRAASHLWARDLAALGKLAPVGNESWASLAVMESGKALFVPAADQMLLLRENGAAIITPRTPGLCFEPEGTLGLRGARLQRISLRGGTSLTGNHAPLSAHQLLRAWHILSAADLTAIAYGMAEQLTCRAVAHATNRIQFPGLFHDESARDPIGKFGVIKQMIAEIAARRYLLETLHDDLTPADWSDKTARRFALFKAVAAEALGTSPGSLAYNAGQIFGGTGYSEDDILSKYYRDASAWRYLGQPNAAVWREHARHLFGAVAAGDADLTTIVGEAEFFDQVASRQALQTELDQLRVLRTKLRGLLDQPNQGNARTADLVARQDGRLLAAKALLIRTHLRLEEGLPCEAQVALLRVWLQYVSSAQQAAEPAPGPRTVANVATSVVANNANTQSTGSVQRPRPPYATYAQFLATPAPYESGDFLCKPTLPAEPRYLPELIQADPFLLEADRYYRDVLTGYFGKQTKDGQPYERLIEGWHRPSEADLDFTRKHGFFRMLIPKELGGEGKTKCEYYLLTSHGQVLADVSWSLAIQANSSIGTTPILLARDKDLPKARKDLAPFVGDASLQKEMGHRLMTLVRLADSTDAQATQKALLNLQQRLDESILKRAVLKALAHPLIEAWEQAGRAAKRFEWGALRPHLHKAAAAWTDVCQRAADYHEELSLRQQACDLALRWIASGQISAFALTEPSAGSDTARVATRAKLRSVKAERQADGTLTFTPHAGVGPRVLLDARLLDFRPEGVYYRFAPDAEPGKIGFDDYDYETDEAGKRRYFLHNDTRVYFTDIAFLRHRDNKQYYDYWELTGAKMWITNGRICGLMSLYAKTEEGVTGFIVDRHAEGLVIGKDEAKMGQNGSPTNEVSLQAVRVPRENVLGLEGRGQVNALETLNVGRAGLAMSAVAQIKSIIAMSRDFVQQMEHEGEALSDANGEMHRGSALLLERMEEERFAAEAVAYEVIGRFEHKDTKSVRMESAMAKMLASELLHSVIEMAEDIHGLEGQTRRYLIEKRKRDARILNIYEGTNEVQRFLILKELVSEVLPRWQAHELAAATPVAAQVDALRCELRERLAAAAQVFGAGLWQNPNLQADGFMLAEAATWLKAMESVAARLEWREQQKQDTALARRTLDRCAREVAHRLRQFDVALSRLKQGRYPESVRAAELLFRDGEETVSIAEIFADDRQDRIEKPLSVLVILEPAIGNMPRPFVRDGQLLEPFSTLTDGDGAALETALRLRDAAGANVEVTVTAVGPPRWASLLREVLALGVNRAVLVTTEAPGPLAADRAAAALAEVLRRRGDRFHLILGPNGPANLEEGLLAPLTARALKTSYAGCGVRLAIRHTADEETLLLHDAAGKPPRTRALPAAVAVTATGASVLRAFTTSGYLAGLRQQVIIEPWPTTVQAEPFKWLTATQAAASTEQAPHPVKAEEAADLLQEQLGVQGGASMDGDAPALDITDVASPDLLDGGIILAVVAADARGQVASAGLELVAAANPIAATAGVPAGVLMLGPPDVAAQQRALSRLLLAGARRIALLAHSQAIAAAEIRARVLAESWPAWKQPPVMILGESWTEPAFIALQRPVADSTTLILRAKRLDASSGVPVIETARAGGRLRTERFLTTLNEEKRSWVSITEDAEVLGGGLLSDESSPLRTVPMRVQRWTPRLDALFSSADMERLLAEVQEEIGIVRLADADIIIDVGYGVGNRDGYEEVILPLEESLRIIGVRNVMIGGSRKVTEELHLLPLDRQIGQSGVGVNPRIVLAIGISGAPQHLNYIGPRATILAFNRDAEAPLMTLNQRQPRPRVFPIIGDLFTTVPAFVAALRRSREAS